jgi:mRNA-degrading endonuclease toxin of MazEF toxin-antitoxin module
MAYASGDIVLVPFPYTDLSAVRTRPAVVVSTDVYARASGDLLIAMVTGQRHDLPTDYALRRLAAGRTSPAILGSLQAGDRLRVDGPFLAGQADAQ